MNPWSLVHCFEEVCKRSQRQGILVSVPLNLLYRGPWFQGRIARVDYQVQSQLYPLKSTCLCSPWTDNHLSGRTCSAEPILYYGMLWIQETTLCPVLRPSHMEISALAPTRCHGLGWKQGFLEKLAQLGLYNLFGFVARSVLHPKINGRYQCFHTNLQVAEVTQLNFTGIQKQWTSGRITQWILPVVSPELLALQPDTQSHLL